MQKQDRVEPMIDNFNANIYNMLLHCFSYNNMDLYTYHTIDKLNKTIRRLKLFNIKHILFYWQSNNFI